MEKDTEQKVTELLANIKMHHSIADVEQLYDCINLTIRHIAYKYLHQREDSEDFVQDFWADIYLIAEKFTFFHHGYAYLCKVATNRAINEYKKKCHRRQIILPVDNEFLFDIESDDPKYDLIVDVNDALATLSPIERIVLESTYYENKTVRQIAAELHFSKSKIHTIKTTACAKFKKYYTAERTHNEK